MGILRTHNWEHKLYPTTTDIASGKFFSYNKKPFGAGRYLRQGRMYCNDCPNWLDYDGEFTMYTQHPDYHKKTCKKSIFKGIKQIIIKLNRLLLYSR